MAPSVALGQEPKWRGQDGTGHKKYGQVYMLGQDKINQDITAICREGKPGRTKLGSGGQDRTGVVRVGPGR